MIYLILSIISSTLIFVIFRYFQVFKIDTFQAIVFNYIIAFFCGVLLYGDEWSRSALDNPTWILYSVICSILFIGLFFVMAMSTQTNGVASTSIAVKMSMVVSLLLMIIGYTEAITWLKIVGMLLAFVGVLLVSLPSKRTEKELRSTWMLILLFFGSGLLDFTLNYVQNYELKVLSPSLFSAFGLGGAGVLGMLILTFRIYTKKSTLQLKNVVAGIVLGIPNYFSIYCLIQSYEKTGWTDSTVLAITNVSIVLGAALLGFIIFKEQATWKKIIGLICAVLAITTLYISK